MTPTFLALIGILAFLLLLYVLTIVYEQRQRAKLRKRFLTQTRRAPMREYRHGVTRDEKDWDSIWGHRNSRMSN